MCAGVGLREGARSGECWCEGVASETGEPGHDKCHASSVDVLLSEIVRPLSLPSLFRPLA